MEIKVSEATIEKSVQEAIATAVTATLGPESFSNFVAAILSTKDYQQRNVIENLAIDAIKKHLGSVIEEWIQQNEEVLKEEVLKAMNELLADKLGEKIVSQVAGAFYLERKRY